MKIRLIKGFLKVFTSGVLVEHFDKNKDGKVSWIEIKSAPLDTWVSALLEVGLKIAAIPQIGRILGL